MYLDVLHQAALLDHSTWAHPDTWNAALENVASRRSSRRGGSFWMFSAVCCIGVIVLILGLVYLMTGRRRR
ncbi:hypothetical protein ACIP5Y_32695 [Nocardia sp. NPDC088792]|uniref:hypothetical protein n=1 Tax=Nocardia sp. NPDC088792 TaxID=3364332 RepID=UPI003809C3D5